jgi:hypothetical protein
MANSNRKLGGGSGSRVNREVGNRVGQRANEMRPRGVSQIGSSMGNHRTDGSGKASRAVEAVKGRPLPAGLSVPLGNAVSLNVGKGGPGTGRRLYGQSGSNKQYGSSATGLPRIANTKGEWPD